MRAIIANVALFLILWTVGTVGLFLFGHRGQTIEYALGLTPAWWPSPNDTRAIVTRIVGGAIIAAVLMAFVWARGRKSRG